MKKSILIIFLASFFLFPLISSAGISMNQNFSMGETGVAEISGNFLAPITNNNIFFYKGFIQDSNFRIPVEHGVANLGGDYYVYFVLSNKSAGNYSLSIENVQYMKGTQISSDNVVQDFFISNETADFSVKPGLIAASNDFSVDVQDLQDYSINLDVLPLNNNSGATEIFVGNSSEEIFPLQSGEIRTINFNLGSGASGFQYVELKTNNSDYELPVYVSSGAGMSQKNLFNFKPSQIIITLPIKIPENQIVYLYNYGNSSIENISLSFSGSLGNFVNLSKNQIDILQANSSIPINLSFFSSDRQNASGYLEAQANNSEADIFINLQFSNNSVFINETNQTIPQTQETCAEMNGVICTSNQKCSSGTVYAKDNVCCLGTCEAIPSNIITDRIIAAAIIIAIVGGLIWFYFAKYKRAKKPVDLVKIAKGKKKSSEEI